MALEWTKVMGESEYNEETGLDVVGGFLTVVVTIYSNRDGEHWCCRIGDGEDFDLDAEDLYAARREAEREYELQKKS